ncbi:hypothetical protein NPIL_387301, partial [Nephila pilipes]
MVKSGLLCRKKYGLYCRQHSVGSCQIRQTVITSCDAGNFNNPTQEMLQSHAATFGRASSCKFY